MEIIKWIYLIFGIFAVIHIIAMVSSIRVYFTNKTKRLNKNFTYEDQLKYNTGLMNLITSVINIEVANSMKSLISLKQPYDIRDLDVDVKKISSKVFNAFKNGVYNGDINMLTDEYIMNYITENVTLVLLDTIPEVNKLAPNENELN